MPMAPNSARETGPDVQLRKFRSCDLPNDAEFLAAINRSDDLELVDPSELADLFADRWTLTEGGEA